MPFSHSAGVSSSSVQHNQILRSHVEIEVVLKVLGIITNNCTLPGEGGDGRISIDVEGMSLNVVCSNYKLECRHLEKSNR